jgi:uncharacterized protein (DUF433 family)
MTTIVYPHIELDADGDPAITGANTKVVIVAIDRLAHHWDANEIQRQRPHLTLGQIYAALAYYYDHEEELNRRIQQRLAREQEILASLPASRVRAKLNAAKNAS